MMLTGLGYPWTKSSKYFYEEMSKQGFQNIISLKLFCPAPHIPFFTMVRVKSLFKNSWLLTNTYLSHSEEANYLQWILFVKFGTFWLSANCSRTDHSWWILWNYSNIYWEQILALGVFCLFALCGTPAMHQLVFQMLMVLNRCWIWAAIWISALQETPWILFLCIPHVGMNKNKSEVSWKYNLI